MDRSQPRSDSLRMRFWYCYVEGRRLEVAALNEREARHRFRLLNEADLPAGLQVKEKR